MDSLINYKAFKNNFTDKFETLYLNLEFLPHHSHVFPNDLYNSYKKLNLHKYHIKLYLILVKL